MKWMQRSVWVLPYIPNPYRPARGLVSAMAANVPIGIDTNVQIAAT